MRCPRLPLWLLCSLAAAGPCQAGDPTLPPDVPGVRAPYYGEVLFQFFQDRSFPALTTVMVSQQFDRLGVHADEAEVLRGGLLLSYGMHREAGAVFERLIARGAPPAVRDRAWFYLARVRQARGLPGPAQAALDQVQGELPPELDDARRLLQAQVALSLDQPDRAAQALLPLAQAEQPRPAAAPVAPDDDVPAPRPGLWTRLKALMLAPFSGPDPLAATDADARLFARYNLGVALIRQGDLDGGRHWLDELGRMPAVNEEQRALRDQANLALGFAALQQGQHETAREWLERVRLNGPSANKALLGFGWAAMGLKNPKLALVPWTELAGRDPQDPAVLEARIAIPHALAELGADPQAQDAYRQALDGFGQADRQLDAAMDHLRSGLWLQALQRRHAQDPLHWQADLADVPALPYAAQLAPVLAGHPFQESYKTWRDLGFLRQNVQDWQERLSIYRDMLTTRRAVFRERLPQIRAQQQALTLGPLRERQAALSTEMARAEAEADGRAFADARERDLLDRVERSRRALSRPLPDTAEAAERLRLLEGRLAWELAQRYPERRWPARKALDDSGPALEDAARAARALTVAGEQEEQRLSAFDARIDALARRLQQLAAPLQDAQDRQAEDLQQQALAGLQTQQQRLAGYTLQARYAMAQLLDRARAPQTPPGADDAQP